MSLILREVTDREFVWTSFPPEEYASKTVGNWSVREILGEERYIEFMAKLFGIKYNKVP